MSGQKSLERVPWLGRFQGPGGGGADESPRPPPAAPPRARVTALSCPLHWGDMSPEEGQQGPGVPASPRPGNVSCDLRGHVWLAAPASRRSHCAGTPPVPLPAPGLHSSKSARALDGAGSLLLHTGDADSAGSTSDPLPLLPGSACLLGEPPARPAFPLDGRRTSAEPGGGGVTEGQAAPGARRSQRQVPPVGILPSEL